MIKNALWIFVFAIGMLVVFLPSYTTMQDLQQRNHEYEQQIAYLKAKQIKLIEEKRLLLEDPVYLEKVAREKMGLIKEGEVIYKITPAPSATVVSEKQP